MVTNTTVLAEGKTKLVIDDPQHRPNVVIRNKPWLTWNDECAADMSGKDVWATETTCNVFDMLVDAGVPVAYEARISDTEFTAPHCRMIPVEVVVRFGNEKNSSYSKRNPDAPIGPFAAPVVEFFLKTSGKYFNGINLPTDDPYIHRRDQKGMWVHHPKKPVREEDLIFVPYTDDFGEQPDATFAAMQDIAEVSGMTLCAAWGRLGFTLGDFKEEFGTASWGEILLADVLDNDSWRIQDCDGRELSKQTVRDGGTIEEAKHNYARIAEASKGLTCA